MKRKWMKRILALGTAALLSMGSFTVSATEPGTDAGVTVSKADADYYKALIGEGAPEKASITITKKVSPVDGSGVAAWDSAKPILDVEFGIKKVGDLAQIEDGTDSYMAYGILESISNLFDPAAQPDVKQDGYAYYKDYTVINDQLKDMAPDELASIFSDTDKKSTSQEGKITLTNQDYGLYLVAELDVSKAQVQDPENTGSADWGKITITRNQYPYVVSAPFYDEARNEWVADVDAKAKNETGSATMEKKIVRGYDETVGPIENENLKDTDVTEVGDTVEFKLTTTVPDLSSEGSGQMDTYILEDNICKGLTLPETFTADNIVITDSLKQEYTLGADYTVSDPVSIPADTSGSIKEGTYFKVTFTDTGLAKLTTLAQEKAAEGSTPLREVYTYYTVTVNENAVVGAAGNPNESRLIFSANGSAEVETSWDKVIEYIFSIKAEKTFDGVYDEEKAKEVAFQLFTGANQDQGIKVKALAGGKDGEYVYDGMAGAGETATEIQLGWDKDSKQSYLSIKGVPVGTDLYLKETKTADGFHLLDEPVKLYLAPEEKGMNPNDEYTGYLNKDNTKVNDKVVLDAKQGDTAEVCFTVNNTSGFQLPSTGGMGAAIFAAIGILIIAIGGGFYFATSKKKS